MNPVHIVERHKILECNVLIVTMKHEEHEDLYKRNIRTATAKKATTVGQAVLEALFLHDLHVLHG